MIRALSKSMVGSMIMAGNRRRRGRRGNEGNSSDPSCTATTTSRSSTTGVLQDHHNDQHDTAVIQVALESVVAQETADITRELQELEQEMIQIQQALDENMKKEQFLGMRLYHYKRALQQQADVLQAEHRSLIQREQQQQQATQDSENNLESCIENNFEDIAKTIDHGDVEAGGGTITTNSNPLQNSQQEQTNTAVTPLQQEEQFLSSSLEDTRQLWEQKMDKWQSDQDALESIGQTHKQIIIQCEEMRRTLEGLEKKKKEILSLSSECDQFIMQQQQYNTNEVDGLSPKGQENDNNSNINSITSNNNNNSIILVSNEPKHHNDQLVEHPITPTKMEGVEGGECDRNDMLDIETAPIINSTPYSELDQCNPIVSTTTTSMVNTIDQS